MSRMHASKSTNNVLITLMNLILFILIKYMIQDSELPSYFLPVEDAEQQERDQAVDEPAGRYAEDVREVAPLEDEDQHAVGRAH